MAISWELKRERKRSMEPFEEAQDRIAAGPQDFTQPLSVPTVGKAKQENHSRYRFVDLNFQNSAHPVSQSCTGALRTLCWEVQAIARRQPLNILLVYPQCPDTFWSFRHVLKFVSKKAAFPPLGLVTVAAMLPRAWNLKLIDLNVAPLTDAAIAWADCVFMSGMIVHKDSAHE